MWPRNDLLRRLGVEHPIIQAPMAGGPSTPALVAAVSAAGALGSFAGGYLSPDAIRAAIREIRRLTDRPFALNLFVPEPGARPIDPEEIARANEALRPFREELGLPPPPGLPGPPRFPDQLAVALEEKVPVFSFTFGSLPAEEVRRLHAAGTLVLGTATNLKEGRILEGAGVDAVVAQGSEAGGHRGTFAGPSEEGLIGTMALVPQLAGRLRVPVIAAGGIMDGRGIVAALALGAQAAQMGTAFLAAAESGAHPRHKEALLHPAEEDRTALTRAFTGRLARGVRNRFMIEMERRGAILPYPAQGTLTQDIRLASARAERADFMSLWAGQGASLATARSAGEIVRDLVEQARGVLGALR